MAKEYNLNCDKILNVIREDACIILGDTNIQVIPDELPRNEPNCKILINSENYKGLILTIFFKTNCQSFLAQGKHCDKTAELIKGIVEKCSLKNEESTLTINNVTQDYVDSFINEVAISHIKSEVPHGHKYDIKGDFNCKLVATFFENGTFLLQGRPSQLFTKARYFVCDKLQTLDDNICITKINEHDISKRFDDEFSSVSTKLTPDIITLIKDGIITNQTMNLSYGDYSGYLFHICKALELTLKKVLAVNANIIFTAYNTFFEYFAQNRDTYVLKKEYFLNKINSANSIYLDEAYTDFSKIRNLYFHTSVFGSSFLQTYEEAVEKFEKIKKDIYNLANYFL